MTTPSLFPAEPPDLAALATIAAGSIPRADLQARGFLAVTKSTDLQADGYTVIDWLSPSLALAGDPGCHVLEYMPSQHARPNRGAGLEPLPRLTATNYAEQVAIHEALRLRVVAPGRQF